MTEDTRENNSRSATSRPVQRLLTVLECVLAGRGNVSFATLAEMVRLPKPTVHRLLATLTATELLTTDASNRYLPGERLVRMLHTIQDPDMLSAIARPVLHRLVMATNETCYLTRLIGQHVQVALMESPQQRSYVLYVLPGKEMPAHAAASAKAIIAFQPKQVVDAALTPPLQRFTSRTICDRKQVLRDYARVRADGQAFCVGEIDDGLSALGVPVHLEIGGVIFAVGITGPTERLMNGREKRLLDQLKRSAAELSSTLALIWPKSGLALDARSSA